MKQDRKRDEKLTVQDLSYVLGDIIDAGWHDASVVFVDSDHPNRSEDEETGYWAPDLKTNTVQIFL